MILKMSIFIPQTWFCTQNDQLVVLFSTVLMGGVLRTQIDHMAVTNRSCDNA